MNPETIRMSADIPAPLHRRLHGAAVRLGCTAQQFILRSIEQVVAEESRGDDRRVRLPLLPAKGQRIRPVTNDEALFS
jgi:hypothetical protein